MRRKAGFTLVELLVVVSLMALIGMSLYAMFGSAMDMMHRVSRSEVAEDVDIFLERFDREISSQVTFKGISFDGKETLLSFPSCIGLDKRASLNRGIGRVSYAFDESHRTFARRQENLNQIYKPEGEIGAVAALEGVSGLKFQYFVYFVLLIAYSGSAFLLIQYSSRASGRNAELYARLSVIFALLAGIQKLVLTRL